MCIKYISGNVVAEIPMQWWLWYYQIQWRIIDLWTLRGFEQDTFSHYGDFDFDIWNLRWRFVVVTIWWTFCCDCYTRIVHLTGIPLCLWRGNYWRAYRLLTTNTNTDRLLLTDTFVWCDCWRCWTFVHLFPTRYCYTVDERCCYCWLPLRWWPVVFNLPPLRYGVTYLARLKIPNLLLLTCLTFQLLMPDDALTLCLVVVFIIDDVWYQCRFCDDVL